MLVQRKRFNANHLVQGENRSDISLLMVLQDVIGYEILHAKNLTEFLFLLLVSFKGQQHKKYVNT